MTGGRAGAKGRPPRSGWSPGRRSAALLLLAGSWWAGGCGQEARRGEGSPGGPLPALPAHAPVARSTGGMVVTGSPHATEAGRRMLEEGGNAADAAVAAAFALAVAEPTQSGLGGRTQVLLRTAAGAVHAIDGITEFPAGYDPETAPRGEHGHAAVGIPGTVAALTRLLEEHGTLPLATVMEPARRWAAEGLVPEASEARRLAALVEELGPGSPVSRVFGGPGGAPGEPGALLVQPDLAAVLEAVAARGRDGFHAGPVAERMVRDMEAHGGFVTAEDLAGYRARDAVPARGSFRGHTVVGSYLPASGATVIEILQILDRLELPEDEALRSAAVAEALLAGFRDREIGEGRPPGEAAAWLTSDSLADRRARAVAARLGLPGRSPAPGAAGGGAPVEPAHTTHVSVADAQGNVVALTQSLGPTGGARVLTPGLGFLYASTMGGYLAGGGPGYRPWSSQAPLLVLRGEEPWLVLGGAGARRILSALVATVVGVVGEGLPLEEALEAPRLHPTDEAILVEEGWAGAEALAALGYRVEPRERSWFARLNVVEIGEDGSFLGAGDPRWSGSAAAGPGGTP